VPGRCFPVEVVHSLEDHSQDYLQAAIDTAVDIHVEQPEGGDAVCLRMTSSIWIRHTHAFRNSRRHAMCYPARKEKCGCSGQIRARRRQPPHQPIAHLLNLTCTTAGDILMFLTGQSEIEKACNKINEAVAALPLDSCQDLLVLPIYAAMPPELQVS
jgi:HrpA-like RNA helicase